MSRRIDIELTSARGDGSWTWRAAGARKPNGVVDGGLLPTGAAVGDVLKVEVEQMLDGIEIQSVVKGREKPTDPNVLELLPSEQPFEAVIETRARRERPPRRDGREGRGRDNREGRGRRDGRRERDGDGRGEHRERRSERSGDGEQRSRPRRERPHFEAPPEIPQRPKPKRLRPGKARRSEVLADLPEEQRPIAEMALQGMSAVRTRVKEENAKLTAEGKPAMPEATVVKMAEDLLPRLRVAEWLDRAEAAQRQLEHLDLRDLRSVVAASDDSIVARDESTRELATELKAALVRKQEEELQLWFGDIDAAIGVGRVIRALRLSSQPPKAGVVFPPDIARRLGEATTAALLPDDPADRWIAVLEAAAFSPVRALVAPANPPSTITDDLRATMTRLGPALPQVAALLGVEIAPGAPMPKPLRPQPQRRDAKKQAPKKQPAKQQSAKEQPAKEQPAKARSVKERSTEEQPAKEQPAKEQPAKEQPAEQQVAEPPAAPAEDAPADAATETPEMTASPTEPDAAQPPSEPVAAHEQSDAPPAEQEPAAQDAPTDD